jgi:protein-disulfide isomerase
LLSAGAATAAPGRPAARARVIAELAGTKQAGNVLGRANAPVTIQWFGDLECPICRQFALGALPRIIQKFVRTGKVKIEYRALETATLEPAVFREQQTAALAAGQQHRMWYYVELFLHEQGEEDSGYVTPGYLNGLAEQVPGLNLARWQTERGDPRLARQVELDARAAAKDGFNGTPSFVIGRTGGPTLRLREFTIEQLKRASALFEPTIERLLRHRGARTVPPGHARSR